MFLKWCKNFRTLFFSFYPKITCFHKMFGLTEWQFLTDSFLKQLKWCKMRLIKLTVFVPADQLFLGEGRGGKKVLLLL